MDKNNNSNKELDDNSRPEVDHRIQIYDEEEGMSPEDLKDPYETPPIGPGKRVQGGRMTPHSIRDEAQQASVIMASEPGWPNARCILTSLLLVTIVGILGLLIYAYGSTVAKKANELVFELFEYLHSFPEPYRTIIFFLTSYLIQVLGVPIACVIITVIGYCYESYILGFAVSMPVCICTNISLYYLFRKTESTYQPLHNIETAMEPVTFVEFIGHLMKDFIETYPYRFGLLLRTLHLPDYAKMYILVKYRATFRQMLLPCLAVDSLNVLLYSFVGSQIKNKFEAMDSKSFSDKPLSLKIVTISAIVLVAIQIGVMIGGIIYTKRKYAEYENTGLLRVTPLQSALPSGVEKPVHLK